MECAEGELGAGQEEGYYRFECEELQVSRTRQVREAWKLP